MINMVAQNHDQYIPEEEHGVSLCDEVVLLIPAVSPHRISSVLRLRCRQELLHSNHVATITTFVNSTSTSTTKASGWILSTSYMYMHRDRDIVHV